MNGRTMGRVLAALLLVIVAVGIGTAVYNAGVTAGFAVAAQQAAASGDPVPVVPGHYGWGGPYGHGFGFGFFGILFWILGIFLIFGLIRAAFGGWGGWGGGPGGRGGRGGRREMIEDWHREMHRRDSGEGSQPASGA